MLFNNEDNICQLTIEILSEPPRGCISYCIGISCGIKLTGQVLLQIGISCGLEHTGQVLLQIGISCGLEHTGQVLLQIKTGIHEICASMQHQGVGI